ncbi:hypothetical protein [Ciceribacter ferrooxidans]|uniref:Uncharacterized protein n=1 Tax=Ciceribacter ferrooxidans TaxID=2509717 RepID=A0A4Q2S6M1_9HYPH|nr:hypothetical protein [Ciceribacter ferrooxidans]RYB96019.1 hypothetical protein EUU22_24775 [Ciceribacter ferrooxidans]
MNLEEAFWSQIDPLYHLKQASCIRYTRDIDQHYRLDEQPSKDTGFGAELLDGMDEMKASALMFIRFHAIETLLTVLLGSHPHGPIPRFAKTFFGSKFNEAVQSVARREIPATLGIRSVTDYDKWIATKFWGRLGTESVLDDEVIKFISVQAALFGQKTVYNAFKHGCRIGRSWPKLSVQDEKTGEWFPLLEINSGVGWLNWEEDKKSKSASVTFGAMACDPDDDHGAVVIMALLVRAMKTIRQATSGDKINVQLPNEIRAGMHVPANLNFRMSSFAT